MASSVPDASCLSAFQDDPKEDSHPPARTDDVVRNAIIAIASKQVDKAVRLKELEGTARHQQRWSAEDNRAILDAFRNNERIEDTATRLRRTDTATRYQRSKLVLQALLAGGPTIMRALTDEVFGPGVSTDAVVAAIDVLHHAPPTKPKVNREIPLSDPTRGGTQSEMAAPDSF